MGRAVKECNNRMPSTRAEAAAAAACLATEDANAVQFPSGVLRRATRPGNETVQGDVRNKPENSIKAARHRLGGLAGDFESNFTTKM